MKKALISLSEPLFYALLSGTADTALLVCNGIVMSCTDLYFLCTNPYFTVCDAKSTSSCWVWVGTFRIAAGTMKHAPSLFCTGISKFISITTIRPHRMPLIHILLFIDRLIPIIFILNCRPCMLVSSCRLFGSWCWCLSCSRCLCGWSRSLSCRCLSRIRCLCRWFFL